MPQLGYKDGVKLDPSVVDYLLKKENPNYQAPNRAQAVLTQLEQMRARQASPEYQGQMAQMQDRSFDNSGIAALARASSQLGTLGGKSADTSPVDHFGAAMDKNQQLRMAQDERAEQARSEYDEARLKSAINQDKTDVDHQQMLASAQDKAADNDFRNRQLALETRSMDLKQAELNQPKNVSDTSKNEALAATTKQPPKTTAEEKTAAYHAGRALDAENMITQIENSGYDPASYGRSMREQNIPFTKARPFSNPADQAYRQAQQEFIASILRKETGASVTPQEFDTYSMIYFPQPGDGTEVVKQKAAARQRAASNLKFVAGAAYDPAMQQPFHYKKEGEAGTAIAAPPSGKIRVKSPNGKIGLIPAEDLEEALSEGYEEMK